MLIAKLDVIYDMQLRSMPSCLHLQYVSLLYVAKEFISNLEKD